MNATQRPSAEIAWFGLVPARNSFVPPLFPSSWAPPAATESRSVVAGGVGTRVGAVAAGPSGPVIGGSEIEAVDAADRRSTAADAETVRAAPAAVRAMAAVVAIRRTSPETRGPDRSEEHTSELQS